MKVSERIIVRQARNSLWYQLEQVKNGHPMDVVELDQVRVKLDKILEVK